MIQITLQFSTIAAAVSALARIDADAIVAGDPVPHAVVAQKVAAALGTTPEELMAPNRILQDLKFTEAPGKPSAAKTARSRPTAEADPSPTADQTAQADALAPSTEATAQAAAVSSASQPVSYPDLQKAVLTLHKMDATAAVPIAKGLGADTFKLLPEAKWAEALRLVNVAIEQRKAA